MIPQFGVYNNTTIPQMDKQEGNTQSVGRIDLIKLSYIPIVFLQEFTMITLCSLMIGNFGKTKVCKRSTSLSGSKMQNGMVSWPDLWLIMLCARPRWLNLCAHISKSYDLWMYWHEQPTYTGDWLRSCARLSAGLYYFRQNVFIDQSADRFESFQMNRTILFTLTNNSPLYVWYWFAWCLEWLGHRHILTLV